uniref:Uncharacterized protein n=1 Tax=Aegilops tauschii subsp. strangulata TaxID=200361 RepID=A0A453D3G7_AEGTS
MFGPPIKDLGDVLRYALSTHQKTEDVTENLKNYMLRSKVMRAPLVCASVAASTGRAKLQPTSETLWFRLDSSCTKRPDETHHQHNAVLPVEPIFNCRRSDQVPCFLSSISITSFKLTKSAYLVPQI